MINLSKMVNLPVKQNFSVKNQTEKNNLAENSQNSVSPKLVSPGVEHLKANYLSFSAKKPVTKKEPVDSEQLKLQKLFDTVTGSFDKDARKLFEESCDIAAEKNSAYVNHRTYATSSKTS